MEVTLLGRARLDPGARARTPSATAATPRACSVTARRGQLVILDMGTGVSHLGKQLMAGAFGRGQGRAAFLLSHAHWDHIQGFPLLRARVRRPATSFTVYGAAALADAARGHARGADGAQYFSPIQTLKNLGAAIDVHARRAPGEVLDVRTASGARARPTRTGTPPRSPSASRTAAASLVYASDAGYRPEGPCAEALELYAGADLLIHDATYTPERPGQRLERGLSSYEDAAIAAVAAGARQRLALFHYDQDYSDHDRRRPDRTPAAPSSTATAAAASG